MTDSSEVAEYVYLQTPLAIRERSTSILERCRAGLLEHWTLHDSRMPEAAARVIELIRQAYPDPRSIPYHSRWRHFDVGGVGRVRAFEERLRGRSADELLAARFELVITSVLLDAGAGADWSYEEPGGSRYARSEGLAVASYHLFCSGALSSDPSELRADAGGLQHLTSENFERAFQVGPENPLAGKNGRSALLCRLGKAVESAPPYFGSQDPRLGNLGLFLRGLANHGRLEASVVLAAVLAALGPIWEGRERCAGKLLGDVWRHSQVGLVPFHKLSQWLTYSLFEPLEAAGLAIDGTDRLTGLAEYRNGGLFVDAEVLELKDPEARQRIHRVDSDLVIEWRALTVLLLDQVAGIVRAELGLTSEELPLARVLEGGTWRAGRALALEKRQDGGPPLKIETDGTVF